MRFFEALGPGCWLYYPNGRRAGLRPESFREVRLALQIAGRDWPDVFADLRVMEVAVLEMEAARHVQ